MSFVRLYSGSDGESHLEDMDMGFTPNIADRLGAFSPMVSRAPVHIIPEKVKGVMVGSQIEEGESVSFTPSPIAEFHPSRQRQYVIFLGGRSELETSDGDKRSFGPGDWCWDEDVASKGHRWRVFDKPWQWCAIVVEE